MVITTVSLLTSAFSVYFDNRSDGVPVPNWIRFLFFKHIARLLCLRHSVEAVMGDDVIDARITPAPEKNHKKAPNDVITVESLDDGKCVTKPPAQRRRADTPEELLLAELRKLTSSLAEREDAERKHDEWRLLAKIFDRCLFWICLCVSSGYGIHIIHVVINQ